MTALQDDLIAELQRDNAALRQERDAARAREATLAEHLAIRKGDFDERIEHQAATIDVLRVMSASPGNPQPVIDLICRHAQKLCNATAAAIYSLEGQTAALHGTYTAPPITEEVLGRWRAQFPQPLSRGLVAFRAILARQIVHVRDVDDDPELLQAVRDLGVKSIVAIPIFREGEVIGSISINAATSGGFSESQIELLQTFAEQAAIAITGAETYRALQARTSDLRESLEYQIATSDVLKVISRSTFDLQPVLDTLIETAARLCDADGGYITVREADAYRVTTTFTASPEYDSALLGRLLTADNGSVTGRTALEGRIVHIHDLTTEPGYALTQQVRSRTALGVPLLREGVVIGTINLGRLRVHPFTQRQIELVSTFADQAVIAIEDARLIAEQREALEQQTATAEVLQVINANPGNLQPVFEAILDRAHNLCSVAVGSLSLYVDGIVHTAATRGFSEEYQVLLRRPYPAIGSHLALIRGGTSTQTLDFRAVPVTPEMASSFDHLERMNLRTGLWVPLRKDGTALGCISAYRDRVAAFSEKEIALLENFAAQAVIAMDNARLLTEQREALEQQTATAEILRVINASPGNLTPIFDAVLEKAIRLCDSAFGILATYDGQIMHFVAMRGLTPEQQVLLVDRPPAPGQPTGRIAEGEEVVHLLDARDQDGYRAGFGPTRYFVDQVGVRTAMWVALRKDKELLGMLTIFRREVRAFSDKEIALVQSFASQAVIAMENARLLDEIRQRQEELRITFENMGDGVAMFDEMPRLVAWNRKFEELLDMPNAILAERPTYADFISYLTERGEYGPDVNVAAQFRRFHEHIREHYAFERTRPDGRVIEVRHNPVPDGGFVLIYADITERKRSEAEIRAARDAAEAAYRDLKAAQANLIQAEKMASLGQLTAGIAHEIKNPLNFVNNFADLSVDLLDELHEAVAADRLDEIDELTTTLKGNLGKIAEHGRRADGIVRGMLEHSRGTSGERRAVGLNTLVEEALNLAYHGARAQDQSFSVTLERDFGTGIAPIELTPQDMTRVLLNLFSNGFYATRKRQSGGADKDYEPVLKVVTRDLGDAVEIRVWDNGTGIPADIKDKLFQPFFTTKPTGEGTGLGLSISYDIVTQQHGGTINVDSEPGAFTEFTIRLPRQ